jgi:hypothetical protein
LQHTVADIHIVTQHLQCGDKGCSAPCSWCHVAITSMSCHSVCRHHMCAQHGMCLGFATHLATLLLAAAAAACCLSQLHPPWVQRRCTSPTPGRTTALQKRPRCWPSRPVAWPSGWQCCCSPWRPSPLCPTSQAWPCWKWWQHWL